MRVIDYRRHLSGALQGFVTLETESGFTISGIAVFSQAGRRWTALPTRPRLRDGKAQRANSGGFISDPVIEIKDRSRKDAWDHAVLTALDRYLEEMSA